MHMVAQKALAMLLKQQLILGSDQLKSDAEEKSLLTLKMKLGLFRLYQELKFLQANVI